VKTIKAELLAAIKKNYKGTGHCNAQPDRIYQGPLEIFFKFSEDFHEFS
jgi:hypothetical protein